jgi:hypothetical protein
LVGGFWLVGFGWLVLIGWLWLIWFWLVGFDLVGRYLPVGFAGSSWSNWSLVGLSLNSD